MSGDYEPNNVVNIADYRSLPKGNGAREALINILDTELLAHACYPDPALSTADAILALLWIEGFKIVPLEREDE